MNKFLVLTALAAAASAGAQTVPVVPAQDLTGVWSAAGGGTLQIFQKDDGITMVFVGPDFAHRYVATYATPTTATGTQYRVTRATGCEVKMSQQFTALNDSQIAVTATVAGGKGALTCDLQRGVTYTEFLSRLQ